jgi:hypothetical protein
VFTLVVSLVVVAASVAAVLRLALADPAQPATATRSSRRGFSEWRAARRARSHQRATARRQRQLATRAASVRRAVGSAPVDLDAVDTDRVGALRRIRSALALLVLLAIVGALLAAAIGTLLFMAGLALRNAVS